MKRSIFILILAFIFASLLFVIYQYFTTAHLSNGALQVTSSPEAKVYINDKFLGQTPLCKCDDSDMPQIGSYTIRLVPLDNSLPEFQDKINVSGGVLTVVDRKFGQDSLSEGSVISLSPLTDNKKIELLVVSFPQGSDVFLDDNKIGQTPLLYSNLTESNHVLILRKDGYNEKSIRIKTTAGYKLTAAVYLSVSSGISSSGSKESSVSAGLAKSILEVTINSTPTGFLRVRATPSLDASESARVNPGQVFPLVSEKDGWFEITLNDGSSGWISSQYAKKK